MSAPAARAVPGAIVASSWLWVATGVLLAIGAIIGGLHPIDAASLPASQFSLTTIAPVTAAVGGVVAGVLHIVIAVFLYLGRHWARVVLTFSGVVAIIDLILNTAAGDILAALNLLVAIAAFVLMFVRPATAYLSRRTSGVARA